jgi:hypothetical protein
MIPNTLRYLSKVESAPARRYRTNVQPQNGQGTNTVQGTNVIGGYGPGSTITINIPTRNNTALIPSESTLKFSGAFVTGNTVITGALDSCGHHGWFQRLRIFHGSNLLQDIDNYAQLAKILYDMQMPGDSTTGRFSITSGTNNDLTGANVATNSLCSARLINRGAQIGEGAGGLKTFNASINLIALVGALAGGKYLPLWQMTSAPLRVEIVLADNINKVMNFDAHTPTNFNLYNVEYVSEFLELPDSAIQAIESSSSNPMQMVFPDWRSFTHSATLGNNVDTQISMPIPAKFSSLKSIVVNQRQTLGEVQKYPLSSGTMGLVSYTFRIGSEVLPSSAPTNTVDFFTEACKCFGSIADINYQPSVDLDSYTQVAPLTIDGLDDFFTVDSGSFLAGIDLETYQNVDKSAIFAGMNTNTSDIFYQPVHKLNGGGSIYYTAFANLDTVLVCENGVAYVRY